MPAENTPPRGTGTSGIAVLALMGMGMVIAIGLFIGVLVVDSRTRNDVHDLLVQGSEECADCPYYVDVELQADLERVTDNIIATSAQKDPISWGVYIADPMAHTGCPVRLMQADFARGTVRLHTGGYFFLGEDVTFDPNPENDFKPYANQTEYAGVAYSLGFFAAITFEAPDIVLDLRGFRIQQSVGHMLAQRFFAVVELGEAPFLGGQGPKDFGPEVTTVNGATVMNGIIGMNSHHCIHGNTGDRVHVKNVFMERYAVAGIALNGFREVAIVQTELLGTDTENPVNGRWSNMRFLKQFTTLALTLANGAHPVQEGELMTAMATLLALEVEVFADIVTAGLTAINATAHPVAAELFGTPDGWFDGGAAYGIVFHPVGHATNGFFFDPNHERTWETRDILLRDVIVGPTLDHPVEIIALAHSNTSAIQKGPVGDIIQVERAMDGGGNYVVDPLVEGQLALAALVAVLPAPQRAMFNTLTVHPDVLAWRAGSVTMATLVSSGEFRYVRNGDNMHHVAKGVIGIRADGVQRMCMQRVEINTVVNIADRAKLDALPGETEDAFYFGGGDGGHANQAPQRGFMGSDVRGLSLAGSNQVYVKDMQINNVFTRFGFAYGVDVFNHAETVNLEALVVRNISTLLFDPPASEKNIAMGPKVGRASGLVTEDNVRGLCLESVTVSDVQSDYVALAAQKLLGCTL